MGLFEELKCRLCMRSFCCIVCRVKHEETFHKINSCCDICVYGQVFMSTVVDDSVMAHIREEHLPVHCVHCGEVFDVLETINLCKCPAMYNLSAITPIRLAVPILNYESPPVNFSANNGDLGNGRTSTPVHNEMEGKEIVATSNVDNKNSLLVLPVTGKKDGAKRVTFGEPSFFESTQKSDYSEYTSNYVSSVSKSEKVEDHETTSNSNATNIIEETCDKEENKENLKENLEETDDSVFWQSAMCCEKEKNKEIAEIGVEVNSNLFAENLMNETIENSKYKNEESDDTDSVESIEGLELSKESKPSLWSSMASVVKNVVSGIYNSSDMSKDKSELSISLKRRRSDDTEKCSLLSVGGDSMNRLFDEGEPKCKKMKLVDVQGRRAIRANVKSMCCQCLITKKLTFDKATQTDPVIIQ